MITIILTIVEKFKTLIIILGRDTNSTLFKVLQYVMHPSFVSTVRNSPYDISVITIIGLMRFTNEIGPACLPFQHSRDSFSGAVVHILGNNSFLFVNKDLQ